MKCLRSNCRAFAVRTSDYCSMHVQTAEKPVAPLAVDEPLYEYLVLCLSCSRRTTIKMSDADYTRLRLWPTGARCGPCGSSGLEWSRADADDMTSNKVGSYAMLHKL